MSRPFPAQAPQRHVARGEAPVAAPGRGAHRHGRLRGRGPARAGRLPQHRRADARGLRRRALPLRGAGEAERPPRRLSEAAAREPHLGRPLRRLAALDGGADGRDGLSAREDAGPHGAHVGNRGADRGVGRRPRAPPVPLALQGPGLRERRHERALRRGPPRARRRVRRALARRARLRRLPVAPSRGREMRRAGTRPRSRTSRTRRSARGPRSASRRCSSRPRRRSRRSSTPWASRRGPSPGRASRPRGASSSGAAAAATASRWTRATSGAPRPRPARRRPSRAGPRPAGASSPPSTTTSATTSRTRGGRASGRRSSRPRRTRRRRRPSPRPSSPSAGRPTRAPASRSWRRVSASASDFIILGAPQSSETPVGRRTRPAIPGL